MRFCVRMLSMLISSCTTCCWYSMVSCIGQGLKKGSIAREIYFIYDTLFDTFIEICFLYKYTYIFGICYYMFVKIFDILCHKANLYILTASMGIFSNQPLSLGCYFWEIYPFSELVIFPSFWRKPYTKMLASTLGSF